MLRKARQVDIQKDGERWCVAMPANLAQALIPLVAGIVFFIPVPGAQDHIWLSFAIVQYLFMATLYTLATWPASAREVVELEPCRLVVRRSFGPIRTVTVIPWESITGPVVGGSGFRANGIIGLTNQRTRRVTHIGAGISSEDAQSVVSTIQQYKRDHSLL